MKNASWDLRSRVTARIGRVEIWDSNAAANGLAASATEFRDKKSPASSLRFRRGIDGDPSATSNSFSLLTSGVAASVSVADFYTAAGTAATTPTRALRATRAPSMQC